MNWTVVVALRSIQEAKSRLRPASATSQAHLQLVSAIRSDTLQAIRGATGVSGIFVVSDAPGDGVDLVQQEPGLNAAFSEAVAAVRQRAPAEPVAVMVADLAALRPTDLHDALRLAATTPRGFVADLDGRGTTLVSVLAGEVFSPSFGPGSASRHAETMTRLSADDRLRCDVDTPDDLRLAAELGLGERTRTLLAARGIPSLTSTRHD
ncbi:2-phospho-L-lactate guanylyltransferase [Jatrophihabitans sp. GAS493]|uniref:2-phospho-L-lactate guanylyltransferase n=1 Tax=Jatrophihabitans sp. GAS493 TaxID=1907575 RepID=UPI000BB6CD54|nr:2-phospho-L-lactate guanylyltransferase [Jatrophihabitans sp. GAS493]SOD73408.1 2-phospho-L-lactate guanylyltransferase [Jatrophihabitans sp. GAS493]